MTQRIYMMKASDIKIRRHSPYMMTVRMMFLLFLIMAVLAHAGLAIAAGGTVLWTAQDARINDQVPVASVTDGNGNVYVTGWSVNGGTDYDWWTTKFSASGSVEWHAIFNASTGTDQPAAIALDSQHNVIVTGAASVGSSKTIHTIKYRGDTGAPIWERSFAGSSQDLATAVTVDDQDNVFVAGYTRNAQGIKHILVIKYSHSDIPEQDGIQLWKAVHDEESSNTEEAWSIAADENGVAVTGFSGAGSDFDMLTAYYNNDGVFMWEQRRNSPTAPPTGDQGKLVRIDASGNVIVTGYLANSPGNTIYTAKYNHMDGALIWEDSYPSIHDNVPAALTVDAAGNVYLAATIWTESGHNDFYLVKYDREPSSGTSAAKLWGSIFDSGSGNIDVVSPSGIIVDAASGDVYVTGYTESGGITSFQTVRYKGDTGVELWHAGYDNPANLSDRSVGIGLSPDGDVLVAGWTGTPANGLDYLTVKYQAGGLNRPTGLVAQAASANSISLSWADNSSNESGFNIYRQDSLSGNWTKTGSTTASSYTDSTGIAANSRYDYYVTAVVISQSDGSLLDESHPSNQAFAVTTILTPADPAAFVAIDSIDHFQETAACIAVGPDNKPVVTGSTMLDIGGYDYLTVKFDADLNVVWKDIYGGDTNGTDEAKVVAVDGANNVVVSGYSELDNGTTGNSSQIFTLKYDGAGNGDLTTGSIWKAQFTGTPRIDDRAEAVATAVDGTNNVAVAGRGRNEAGNYDVYVVKYGPNANPDAYGNTVPPAAWQAQPFDGGGDDQPAAVAFDANGNIFVAGFAENNAEGEADSGSATTLTDTAATWTENQWRFATLSITSGLNAGEVRTITGNTSTALTVDVPFSFPVAAGTSYTISDYDWFVAKYNGTTGSRIWTDIYDSGYGNDRAYGAAVDPVSGDLYVAGYRSNAAGNTDIYTVKYKGSPASAPVAEKIWSDEGRSFDGAGQGEDYAVSVRVTPVTRRIVVGGTVETGTEDHDFALLMYDPDGAPVWSPAARVPLKPESDDYAVAMTVDNSENIYVAGTIIKNDSRTDSMTLKYSTEGVLLGTTVFDGAAHLNDESSSIAANSRGDIFVAGSTQASSGNTDLLLYKISPDSLQAPYPFTAVTSYRSVNLSWPDNSTGEGGYILQRAQGSCSAAGAWVDLGILPADTTSYTDNNLNVGTAHCYRIQSFIGTKGNAGYRESLQITTNAVTRTPEPPGTLTVTAVNTTQVNLSWTLPTATGHTGFIVERCTGGGCTFTEGGGTIAFPQLSPDATTLTDTTVCAGTTYRYRITTVNRGLSLDNSGSWTTRKQVTFASFQPNTYTRITIGHAAPMKADFSDLRFYDPVGKQELPYWVENKTDGASAVIAVKTGVTDKAYLYYGNNAAQPVGPVTGLVAYWPFNETAGTVSGTIADRSGNGFNGTLTYSQLPNGIIAAGKFGNGLSLDGANDHIRVTDTTNSLLDITGSFTIETWYQYAPSGDWARIFSKPTTGNASPYHLYALLLDNTSGAQKPYVEFGGTGSPKGPSLTAGNWYHLVGRYNAATGRASVFVNGVEYGQNITPVTIGTNDMTLGIGAAGIYGAPVKGTLDEVRIYNRAMSNQEIVNRSGVVASAVTLGALEQPPNGATYFDFSPTSWQSAYVNGASSAAMPAAPAPTLSSATRVSEARIDLSWTDNSSDETGFQIERMCTAGTGCADADYTTVPGGSLSAFTGTGTKTFSDTGLTPNWTYNYRIRALKSGACGWGGAVSGVKTASTTVNAPVVTSTTQVNTTRLDLAWTDDAATLSGYRVERCTGTSAACASGTFTTVGGTPAKTYDDISACENTDYTYRVASLFSGLSASGGPWGMRAPVTISNFQTNFRTRLTITYNSAMKSDFSDIRFYDTIAARELPYWVESKTDGVSATVWLKTGDNNAIHLYYGNRKATSSSSMAAVFGSGLMGFYQFEEPAGTVSGTTADISGTGNHPTLNNVVAPYGIVAGGLYGNALSLDGTGMNARKDPVTLPTGSVMSVEAWIKPTGYTTTALNGIVSWGWRTSANTFDLSVQNNGRPSLATWSNDFIPATGVTATLNGWNHIAAVMNGTAVTLYMNGQPVSGTLGTVPNVISNYFIIGSTDWISGRNFKGLIDEVKIYNRALTPQEIASSYATTLPAASVDFASAEAASSLSEEWLGPYSAITALASKKTVAAVPPTGLAVSWKSDSQLDLSWIDTNNDESGFKIERCADEACCRDSLCTDPARKTVITVTGTQTTYTDSGLNPDATYWYRVRSFKNSLCGWDKGGYGANDVKSGTTTVKAPENMTVTPSLFTNCNDIRLADATGSAVYPHWAKMGCGTADTAVVARIPSVAGGQSSLFLYYGNLAASNASNGAAVSEVFDDFQNLSAWTTSGDVSTDGNILTVNGTPTIVAFLSRNFSVAGTFAAEVKYQHPSTFRNRLFLTTPGNGGSPTGWDYGIWESINWNYAYSGVTLTPNTWYTLRWENNPTNYTFRVFNQNGSQIFSGSKSPAIANLQGFAMSGGESNNSDFKVDWFSVRKTALPAPVTLLDPLKTLFPSSPYTVGGVTFQARKELSVTNSTGSALTDFPVDMMFDTRSLATDRITIGWSDPSGMETGFSLIRCQAADLVSNCDPETSGTWSVTAPPNSGTTASYADATVAPASRFCYKVKALVEGVATTYNPVAVCAGTQVPTKPTGLAANITGTRVDLTWTDTSPAIPAGYVVERCKIVSGGTCSFDTSDATFTTFSLDHSLKTFTDPDACGGTYRYRVKSVKPWIAGWPAEYDGPVEAAIGVPTAPSGLNAQAATETQINLSWTDNTTDETKFLVQRCSLASCTDTDFATLPNGTLSPNAGTGAMTFVDNTAVPNITYTYRIVAMKEGSCSWTVVSPELTDPSKTRTARTAPVLTATPVNSTRIDLSWTDTTAGESGYRVIRCTDADCTSPTTLTTLGVNATSYRDTGVCNSTQPYYYQVAGFKSAALSFGGGGTWTKRAKLNITGFQQNFQTKVSITVANFPGMDATLKDVRFHDATAGAELPYWIEGIASGVATVHVRTGNNNDIYLYYGNASATAASSGVSTYLLFEDFESGMGRMLNGKAEQVTTPVKSGSYAGKLSSTGTLVEDYIDLGSMIKGKVTVDYYLPQALEIGAAMLSTSGWGSNQAWAVFRSNSYIWASSGTAETYLGYYGANSWNRLEMNFDTTADTFTACFNENCSGGTRAFAAPSNDIRYLRLARPDSAGETIYFDNVRVGAYAATQPTTSLGAPETSAGYAFSSSWADDNRSAIVPGTTLALTAPALNAVTNASDNRINLTWTDANSDETGFILDRCADSSCGTVIRSLTAAVAASNTGSFQDVGLLPGTTYYYRLRAYKTQAPACGGDVLGSWSDILNDTTDAPVPTNLTAAPYGSNTVNLAWYDTTQGDTGFAVERCDGDPCTTPFTQVGATGSSPAPYVVRYTFNNTLQDSSGSGLHLTGTTPVYEDGGLRLSTSSSYLSPVTSILDNDYYTIEFDFKMKAVTPNATTWYPVFHYKPPNTDRSPGIWMENASRAMFTWQHDNINYSGVGGLGPNSCNSTSQFAIDSWYHIKGVKSGSNFKIYINGSPTPVCESTNVAFPKVSGSSPLYFGGAEIVLRNFTITNDAVTRRMFTDSTVCSGNTYTYQVKAVGGGLPSSGGGCWKRRAKVTFTASSFVANHQTRLTIDRSTYPEIKSDFRDIRFYDTAAWTEIPYWVEKISGNTATVWIRTGSSDSIYLYYGNDSASSSASGTSVFEIFDDFDGNSLDPNIWTITDLTGLSVSGGKLHGTNTTGKLESTVKFGPGMIVEAKALSTKSAVHGQLIAGVGWEYSTWTDGSIEWRNKNNALLFMNHYNSSGGAAVPGASFVLYRLKLKEVSSVDGEARNYDTDAVLSTFANISPSYTSSSPYSLALGRALYSDDKQGEPNESYATDWDWVRVRKYAATEPTATLGAVEGDGIACQGIGAAWPSETSLVSNRVPVVMPLPVAPAAPAVTASGAQTTVSWVDTTVDESGFSIERCAAGAAASCDFNSLDGGFPKTAAANSTSFTDSGLAYRATYCYRVRSSRSESCGERQSPYASPVCTTTAAAPPFNLKAEAQNSYKIRLTWEYDVSEAEAGFEVERMMPNGMWSQVGRTAANVTTFDDLAGIEPGKGYRYRVRAFYGSTPGSMEPSAWTQRAFIRNVSGAIVAGEDITRELTDTPIEIVDATNGSARITPADGKVEMATSSMGGGSSTATSTSRVLLKNLAPYAGDFDVQVDYSLPDGQSSSGEWIVYSRLHVAFGANYASIYRVTNNGTNQYYGLIYSNGTSMPAFIPTADITGKLRIKRQGDVTKLYVMNSGTWLELNSGSCSFQPATSLQLLQEVRRKDTAAVRSVFSNFIAAPYTSPYSDEATVTYTSGGTTIPTTPPYVPGASPCD